MKSIVCIICPNSCLMTVDKESGIWAVKGNLCPRGERFAISEMTNPARSICSTVKTTNSKFPRLPVRTDREVPLKKVFDIMTSINKVLVDHPVHLGDILLSDVCGTGANIIATSDSVEQTG